MRAEIEQLKHSRNRKRKHSEDFNKNNGIVKAQIQRLHHNFASQDQMNELAAAARLCYRNTSEFAPPEAIASEQQLALRAAQRVVGASAAVLERVPSIFAALPLPLLDAFALTAAARPPTE